MPIVRDPTLKTPLRLWPGAAIVILQWLVTYAVPLVVPDAEAFSLPVGVFAVLAGAVGGLAVVIWWMFFSRAPWSERVAAIILMIVAMAGTKLLVHESISGAGMGMWLYITSIPVLEPRARRMGVGHSPRFGRRSARGVGCSHRDRVRTVDAPPDRGRRRRRCGAPFPVDANTRATAPGPGQ